MYSRSQSSAEKLAKDGNVDSYFDFPSVQDRSLDTLLERDDIHAVTIALPIPLQSEYIRRSLSAGKHVLSEKPIAKDIATAENLIDFHRKLSHAPVWGVAENFRFVEFMTTGAEKVKELAGKVVTFQTKLNTLMKDDDKFLNTEWYAELLASPVQR